MQKLPQLTLRDLFWLVALVAMGCGWWISQQGWLRWKQTTEEFFEVESKQMRELHRRELERQFREAKKESADWLAAVDKLDPDTKERVRRARAEIDQWRVNVEAAKRQLERETGER